MMNEETRHGMGDFEQRLQRQPLRQVPPAWREEILAAAEASRRSAAAQSVSKDQAPLLVGWRLLFARLPIAWASLAALWLALIGTNLMMPSPMVKVTTQVSPSARLELLAALDYQRAELEASANQLAPAPDTAPANRKPAVPVRPHSERRRGTDFGETRTRSLFDVIA
jgi:hypothetical protein